MFIDFENIRVPRQISPCPIVEAVVELRFESLFPRDAVFGIVYSRLPVEYKKTEPQSLPIIQLPEAIRSQEESLRYKPYFQCSSAKGFLLQIGGRVVSLHSKMEYCGWSMFSEKIRELIGILNGLNFIEKYSRVGVRYINGFRSSITSNINLKIQMSGAAVEGVETNLLFNVPYGSFVNTLRIIDPAMINLGGREARGAAVDIDTSTSECGGDIIQVVEEAHEIEKKLFFGLLKNDYLDKEFKIDW